MKTPHVAGSKYNPDTNQLTVAFDRSTDMSTMFYFFAVQEDGGMPRSSGGGGTRPAANFPPVLISTVWRRTGTLKRNKWLS